MSNSPATIQKALYWLNKQDHNWPQHIEDSNTAVKMYLKSQKGQTEPSEFQKKLEKFCSKEKEGAFLIADSSFDKKQELKSQTSFLKASPPQNLHQKKTAAIKKERSWTACESKSFAGLQAAPPHLKPAPLKEVLFSESSGLGPQTFVLDERSLQSLEETKKEWNLQSSQDALRLLIQAGEKSLNRLKGFS